VIKVSIIILTSLAQALSQQPTTPLPQANANAPAWTEHYRRATVSIGREVTIGQQTHFGVVGTGVLITDDNHHVFLATAKHVFDEPEQNWHPSQLRVRFSVQEKKSFTEELGIPLTLTDQQGRNLWNSLPDGSDIAVIPLMRDVFGPHVTDAIAYQDFATDDDMCTTERPYLFSVIREVLRT
jgi:hypothetical protein